MDTCFIVLKHTPKYDQPEHYYDVSVLCLAKTLSLSEKCIAEDLGMSSDIVCQMQPEFSDVRKYYSTSDFLSSDNFIAYYTVEEMAIKEDDHESQGKDGGEAEA